MMSPLQCLIIEDEPLAAEVLEDYIAAVPFLQLQAICTDAIYALETLRQQPIDVIFLDLHLPKLKGFDFLKTLPHPPQVIVTTAYHQYAIQGYELAIVDYLLKPIEFERFLKAVNKLTINSLPTTNPTHSATEQHFYFKVNKKNVKVKKSAILYIESLKEYVKIVTVTDSLVTKYQIGALHQHLGETDFIRIHRSFLVAPKHIHSFSATTIEIGEKQLPIGRSYQQVVLRTLAA